MQNLPTFVDFISLNLFFPLCVLFVFVYTCVEVKASAIKVTKISISIANMCSIHI